MKKNKVKIWVDCGLFCIAAVLLSAWYAVTFADPAVSGKEEKEMAEFECRLKNTGS